MHLLPSEQKAAIDAAIDHYRETGKLAIYEPCDCGSHIRHNNGGNYHEIIHLRTDGGRHFVKYASTCELSEPAEWETCEDPEAVIRENGDWL